MHAKVVKLWENGQRLPKERTTLSYSIEGEIEVFQYINDRKGYDFAQLTTINPNGMQTIEACLYQPRLTSLRGNVLFLDGLEKIGERLVLQQWKCLIV